LTKAGKAQQRFLYVAGAVLPDGSARFEPFEVISTTEDIETRPKGGSYTLVVDRQRAERGVEKPFEPSTLSVGGKEQPRPFGLFVPYDETISRVTLRRGDAVVAERRPSAHSPEVALTPLSDAVMGGRRTLSWSA